MLRVAYHFVGDLDLIEEYYCEPSRAWVQERAYTLGAVCFTPEVVNVDDPDADGGSVPRLRGRDRDDVHVEHESQR